MSGKGPNQMMDMGRSAGRSQSRTQNLGVGCVGTVVRMESGDEERKRLYKKHRLLFFFFFLFPFVRHRVEIFIVSCEIHILYIASDNSFTMGFILKIVPVLLLSLKSVDISS